MKEEKTILVVDDEPDVSAYLCAMIEELGYKTVEANSPEQAGIRLRNALPDLMTLDVMMKGKSGLLFYRDLKADPSTASLPVVFVSAFGQARDFEGQGFRKLLAGHGGAPEPEAFVEKPVTAKRLAAALERAFEKARAAGR